MIGAFGRDAALPGRRQLAGHADPVGHTARRACATRRWLGDGDLRARRTLANTGETTDELFDEALRTAADADVIVVFAGLPAPIESEGFDRPNLDLPAGTDPAHRGARRDADPGRGRAAQRRRWCTCRSPIASMPCSSAGSADRRVARPRGRRAVRRRRARRPPRREHPRARRPAAGRPELPRASPARSSTARVSTSATASTTAPVCRPGSRSATGCPTRRFEWSTPELVATAAGESGDRRRGPADRHQHR